MTSDDLTPEERAEVQEWWVRSWLARRRREQHRRAMSRAFSRDRHFASECGKMAHQQDAPKAHEWGPDEARAAAAKSVVARRARAAAAAGTA